MDSVAELRRRALVTLEEAGGRLGFKKLRDQLGVGAEKVSALLHQLQSEGLITKVGRVWSFSSVPQAHLGKTQSGTEPEPDVVRSDRTIQKVGQPSR